ncbi:unnamed protein product, partial [Effrenium voratum]
QTSGLKLHSAQISMAQISGTLAVDDEDDDLAMDRVIQQHDVSGLGLSSAAAPTHRFNRSYNAAASSEKRQFGYEGDSDEEVAPEPSEPPPESYLCHRCGIHGSHWAWECPTNDDPEHVRRVRPAKGIPRQFLRK